VGHPWKAGSPPRASPVVHIGSDAQRPGFGFEPSPGAAGRRPLAPPCGKKYPGAVWLFGTKRDPDAHQRLDAVESQIRLLRQEWTETLDRVEHLMRRIAKRVRTEAREGGTQDQGELEIVGPGATSRLDPITEKLLRRRNRHVRSISRASEG